MKTKDQEEDDLLDADDGTYDESYDEDDGHKPKKLLYAIDDVCHIVSMSESAIRRLMDEGRFPKAIRLGGRRFWRRREIRHWVAGLPGSAESPN